MKHSVQIVRLCSAVFVYKHTTLYCRCAIEVLVPFVFAKQSIPSPPLQPDPIQIFMMHEILFPLACCVCLLCTYLNPITLSCRGFKENDTHFVKAHCNNNAFEISLFMHVPSLFS